MRSFFGYRREDGTLATRNVVVVVTTSADADDTAAQIAETVPEVVLLRHAAVAVEPEDAQRLSLAIGNLCKNPNVYAAVVVGQGPEAADAKAIADLAAFPKKLTVGLIVDEDGGVDEVVRLGIQCARYFVAMANMAMREKSPVGDLTVGIGPQAEGPAIDRLIDWIIGQGAAVVAAEGAKIGRSADAILDYAQLAADQKGLFTMAGAQDERQTLLGLFAAGAQIVIGGQGPDKPASFPGAPVLTISGRDGTGQPLTEDQIVDSLVQVLNGEPAHSEQSA